MVHTRLNLEVKARGHSRTAHTVGACGGLMEITDKWKSSGVEEDKYPVVKIYNFILLLFMF